MAAARRVVEGHHYVHSGKWRAWYIDLLVGHDIITAQSVFSNGRIGQAMAKRAGGFSMRI
jgi:lactate dehydrogenase-like 2-hydroxyacid dehydrogenase